jgi:hypothetical protein
MTSLAALAVAAHLVSLPSPLTPLSASPPLAGGAHTSGEGTPHRIAADVEVGVTVDTNGTLVGLRALQRLDVRRIGDYTFTIGAPVTRVLAARGSQSAPGQRTGAILWAGFNPGRRVLAASAELDPSAGAALPLRIERDGDRVILRNTTAITAPAFTADAQSKELLSTLAAFRNGSLLGGRANVTSKVTRTRISVSAPLSVTGSIGGRRVDVVLGGAASPLTRSFPAGAVRLTVRALRAPELLSPPPGESGRALLARTIRASLELARVRQYDTFLGNPDPAGASTTTYRYVTGVRATAPSTAHRKQGRDWLATALWIAGAIVAAGVGAVVWSRS